MKILTVRQPWAGLIVSGVKDVENRRWQPDGIKPGSRFGIHSGRWDNPQRWEHLEDLHTDDYVFQCVGLVIATVRLVDVVRNSTSPWAEKGYWHWVLDDPKLYKRPRMARGWPGLWEIPKD